VPVHVQYILTEILKNSFRATVETHHAAASLPPVEIIVSPAPKREDRPAFISMRIRDQGGGVSPSDIRHIFSYAYSTAGRKTALTDNQDDGGPYTAQAIGGLASMNPTDVGVGEANVFSEIAGRSLQMGMGTIAGLGYGLPLARLYATYFGGSLELVSLHGHGTDVFIKLRSLDHGGDILI